MTAQQQAQDHELTLRALYEARDGCYSPELKADYQRLIDKMESEK